MDDTTPPPGDASRDVGSSNHPGFPGNHPAGIAPSEAGPPPRVIMLRHAALAAISLAGAGFAGGARATSGAMTLPAPGPLGR